MGVSHTEEEAKAFAEEVYILSTEVTCSESGVLL